MRKLLLVLFIATTAFAGAARAQFCPGAAPYVFTDVPANDSFCSNITWMAATGVTTGCQIIDATNRLYCPDDFVTRKQMAAFMKRQADAVMPLTCTSGQVMKWNGAAWTCADDNIGGSGGGGSVTSVLAGTGLQASPNPITSSGSLNLAPAYQLPQGCDTNQVPKWSGSTWSCGTDGVGGTGTVTSITAGIGLSGGTITSTGTIAADTTVLQARVSGNCAVGSSIRAIAADGTVTCQADTGTSFPANVLWVAQSGAAFNTITAAMNYAGPLASAINPFLIKVAPGTYTERVVLEDYVQIEGSGRGITTITSTAQTGTILAAASAGSELRRLSIHNANTSSTPYAIFGMSGSAIRLVDVALSTYNASANPANTIATLGSVEMQHSTIRAAGPGSSNGLFAQNVATISMRDSDIAVQSDFNSATGIEIVSGTLDLVDSRITATSAAGSAYGISASGSTAVAVANATVAAMAHSSGLARAVIGNVAATMRVRGSVLEASGGFANSSAVRGGASQLRISHSELRGTTSGTPVCFGNYDANLAPVACP